MSDFDTVRGALTTLEALNQKSAHPDLTPGELQRTLGAIKTAKKLVIESYCMAHTAATMKEDVDPVRFTFLVKQTAEFASCPIGLDVIKLLYGEREYNERTSE